MTQPSIKLHPELREKLALRILDYLQHDSMSLSRDGLQIQAMALILHELQLRGAARDIWQDIREFHAKFKQGYDGPPRMLPKELQQFRLKAMGEELEEYEIAVNTGPLDEQFDALIDLIYFTLGTALLHGFPFNKGWERVHEKNMAKKLVTVPGESKRGFDKYDVVKPEGWVAPDLKDLVR